MGKKITILSVYAVLMLIDFSLPPLLLLIKYSCPLIISGDWNCVTDCTLDKIVHLKKTKRIC